MPSFSVHANVVDVHARRVFPGTVVVENGRIAAVCEEASAPPDRFVLPGFVDAHVHVESSMMVPSEFARFAVVHGTVSTVSDPHEIANVLGVDGVQLMVENGRRVPFKFHFGAPSCVPATAFETSGATLTAADVRGLCSRFGLGYLSEMMNYPGVLNGDPAVLAKLEVAKTLGLPIDGHAPGLRGEDARRYAAAGISTDHECFTLEEALDKLACGMKIQIREGSAAKNFAALHTLLRTHPDRCMLCSDDLHPDSFQRGHINLLVRRALTEGHDLFAVLRAASLNPVEHYQLPVGMLRPGEAADFIVVDDLRDFAIRQTYIDGRLVADAGKALIDRIDVPVRNRFGATPKRVADFHVPVRGRMIRVMAAYDGQLLTDELHLPGKVDGGRLVSDAATDVLKIAVVNRYVDAPPAVAFVRGFGLKRGAIAASVAHDSHNVVAVGVTDEDVCAAVNAVVDARGGLAVVDGSAADVLPLEVAGLMSRDGAAVAAGYARLDAKARGLGSPLTAPFMTLSFMALLVIPALKLSDRGLFDGREFRFTKLEI